MAENSFNGSGNSGDNNIGSGNNLAHPQGSRIQQQDILSAMNPDFQRQIAGLHERSQSTRTGTAQVADPGLLLATLRSQHMVNGIWLKNLSESHNKMDELISQLQSQSQAATTIGPISDGGAGASRFHHPPAQFSLGLFGTQPGDRINAQYEASGAREGRVRPYILENGRPKSTCTRSRTCLMHPGGIPCTHHK